MLARRVGNDWADGPRGQLITPSQETPRASTKDALNRAKASAPGRHAFPVIADPHKDRPGMMPVVVVMMVEPVTPMVAMVVVAVVVAVMTVVAVVFVAGEDERA